MCMCRRFLQLQHRHTHTFTFMKFISKPNEIKHVLKVSQNWLNNSTVEYGIKCTCQMLVLRLFVLNGRRTKVCIPKRDPDPGSCTAIHNFILFSNIYYNLYCKSYLWRFCIRNFSGNKWTSMSLINFESHFGLLEWFGYAVRSVRCGL